MENITTPEQVLSAVGSRIVNMAENETPTEELIGLLAVYAKVLEAMPKEPTAYTVREYYPGLERKES